MNVSMTIAHEFERESHRIDQLIWDSLALRAGQTVLFCGFANNLEWMKRAAALDVRVSVISDDDAAIRDAASLPVTVLRGSTSMLPAKDASFDAAIAFHYLHEVDPLFHANIVSELARVGKRCAIVEPAPPSDPLGLRIAALYSRAKRQLGQFENYHQLEYWRKLVAIVKPDVRAQAFTFLRTPPKQAVRDTVALILDTMAAESTPDMYLTELRALAARPEAQLLPQARYVVIGTSPGVALEASAGTTFRDAAAESARTGAVKRFIPPSIRRDEIAGTPSVRAAASSPHPQTRTYSAPETAAEVPEVTPPPARPLVPPAAVEPFEADAIARNAFGLPPASRGPAEVVEAEEPPESFGLPAAATAPAEFGWAWEPPEDVA